MVNGEIYNTYLQMSAVIKAQAQLIFLANIGLQTFMELGISLGGGGGGGGALATFAAFDIKATNSWKGRSIPYLRTTKDR
jgi:hypothetical protein